MENYRKAIVALLGALAQVVALNVLPDRHEAWLSGLIAFATALGVFVVPNEPPP